MSWQRRVVIACDGTWQGQACRRTWTIYDERNPAQALAAARERGWRIGYPSDDDRCPSHVVRGDVGSRETGAAAGSAGGP